MAVQALLDGLVPNVGALPPRDDRVRGAGIGDFVGEPQRPGDPRGRARGRPRGGDHVRVQGLGGLPPRPYFGADGVTADGPAGASPLGPTSAATGSVLPHHGLFGPRPPTKIPNRRRTGPLTRVLVTTAKGRGAGGAGNARRPCSSQAAQAREPGNASQRSTSWAAGGRRTPHVALARGQRRARRPAPATIHRRAAARCTETGHHPPHPTRKIC